MVGGGCAVPMQDSLVRVFLRFLVCHVCAATALSPVFKVLRLDTRNTTVDQIRLLKELHDRAHDLKVSNGLE